MERRDKINYYLDIAEAVSKRSTCLRRIYGAVIVKNDEIISTGYVGAPRGRKNCSDLNYCVREKLAIPRGERYELCRSVHAEMNAIISAPREKMLGATLYLVGFEMPGMTYIAKSSSCSMCKRTVINAGIEQVIIRDDEENYRIVQVSEWIENDESLEGIRGY
ncbi:MAG: cytidine deaminase [Lachnospiraceae bacterium]|nr:cytidine deaminase [Lachnospiraceae bacterium]